MPGELLVDVVSLALCSVYPDVLARREKWLRGEIAEFLAKDAVKPTFPVIMVHDAEGRIAVSMTVWRVVDPVISEPVPADIAC